MSDTITLPCADGTDPGCKGELTHTLPVDGLTEEQLDDITRGEGDATIELTAEQMRQNGLTKDDIDFCEQEQRNWLQVSLDTTCAFCGSDQ